MKIENYLPPNEFIDQMPGLFVILDLNSKFIAANKIALDWTGFDSRDLMIGKTYSDMHCQASLQHKNFINQDKLIFKNNGRGKIFGLYCYKNEEWKVILAEKYALRDQDANIVGLVSYITDLTHANIVDINKFITLTSNLKEIKLQQNGYLIDVNMTDISLSGRQSECLFFLLRGKSAKEISRIIQLSPRTIEMYFDQLKFKFNCQSKSELIEKAISYGYMNALPQNLFNLFCKK